ncbi:hypothetical protein KEM52_000777 [Ascosphaera acerosa]|nr:hypothetical protein KEM52_000777 [Ascosphaera acerosa]
MAWDHLDIDKPHVAYMILGGFTSLFMLCSLFVKEKLYIGEATVATICGLIFGPHAADLFDPISWGNVDKITLECSRIVLVVQCFAVGVELPKNYMERHWKSVFLLLVPVMTWGWLVTSLFIWWMVPPLTWLEGLICAACVTATDPVLASSVVGKGKFAKRVPKHLRDLLSAESGCNDGMAFPFIYLSLYIYRYRPDSNKVGLHWICVTILYECIFGAVFGFAIGYIARHLIKFAERKSLIDRESFLVFYFVLALFCAGSGSLLGMDDLLIGFAAGVGFSNDGWFTEKTEESHVSNVIDLLLNLAYFVYFGSIIPWQQFNQAFIGLHAWRLVIISIFVVLFRRIPIMLLLKPIIPDIKTWREALFAGHFGPIGVGAIFASILARAELETDSTQPLHHLPKPGDPEYHPEHASVITLIWPITTFMVITSIIVHGSSIAVFTLGKRINTLTITMSYTTANEEGPSWMNRLPRIASQSRGSMSLRKPSLDAPDASAAAGADFPPGTLPPVGMPYNMLRRQKEEEEGAADGGFPAAAAAVGDRMPRARRRRRKHKRKTGLGGPISQSAIAPLRLREEARAAREEADEEGDQADAEPDSSPVADEEKNIVKRRQRRRESAGSVQDEEGEEDDDDAEKVNTFVQGRTLVFEDQTGNVVGTADARDSSGTTEVESEKAGEAAAGGGKDGQTSPSGSASAGRKSPDAATSATAAADEPSVIYPDTVKRAEDAELRPATALQSIKRQFVSWGKRVLGRGEEDEETKAAKARAKAQHNRPARAYQFGNTVIVEDEDGEVIKKYDIPSLSKPQTSHAGGHAHAGTGAGTSSNAPAGADQEHPSSKVSHALGRAGTWVGLRDHKAGDKSRADHRAHAGSDDDDDDDDKIRFTVNHPAIIGEGGVGRRMSKQDFIRQIQRLDPKTRREILNEDETPRSVVAAFGHDGRRQIPSEQADGQSAGPSTGAAAAVTRPQRPRSSSSDSDSDGDSSDAARNIHETLTSLRQGHAASPAEARRQRAAPTTATPTPRPVMRRKDSEDDGTERIPPATLRQLAGHAPLVHTPSRDKDSGSRPISEDTETPAERKRRLAALGKTSDTEDDVDALDDDDDDDDDDDGDDDGDLTSEDGTSGSYDFTDYDEEAGNGRTIDALARIRDRRRQRGLAWANAQAAREAEAQDSDSEDNGEPRAVRGKVQFADGYHPARSRGPTAGAGRADSSSPPRSRRRHKPTISWGGERGRNR